MRVEIYSYRFSEEILQHKKYKHIYDELITICKDCPIAIYPGKSKKQDNLNVIQQILNTYFSLRFTDLGWISEPNATPDSYEDGLRSDFRKTFSINSNENLTVQIEIEFGNSASSYRNYFKFQLSYSNNLTDICILIVPSYNLAKRIDSGVANFEKIIREIPSAKLSITVPILVIGLFDDGNSWNVKEIEEDLNILKGSKKIHTKKHEKIVRDYVNKL